MKPTHAGGIVARRDGGSIRYLLISAKLQPDLWVLPKGRIEDNESPAEAARREVLEEAGVDAVVREPLDTLEFDAARGRVRALFFLMDFVSDGAPSEDRKQTWLDLDGVLRALKFPDARALFVKASKLLEEA